jgi:uncharacterized membrane protein required for colicin V production
MYFNIFIALIFFVCVASLVNGGLWSNAIMFLNVMSSALLASSLWEPLAGWFEKEDPTYMFMVDFVAIWAIFCGSLLIMRAVTDLLSNVKVRFRGPVNKIGGIFFACWTAWVVVCFTSMTMHMAPLARNSMGFQETPETNNLYIGPDRLWLGFVQRLSLHSLGRSGPTGQPYAYAFDPRGEFILKYGARRALFEKQLDTRVRPEQVVK